MSQEKSQKIGKTGLTALIISSAIGTGIFGLMSQLASQASPGSAIVAWVVVDIGFAALVYCLNHLAQARPELDSGIFSYAGAAFGPLGEFISGWGYWLASWVSNIAFCTMIMSALGNFLPIFKGGQNLPSVLLSCAVVWLITLLVSMGLKSASFVNALVTVCKLIPLLVFLVVMFAAFKSGIFTSHFWENVASSGSPFTAKSLFTQVQGSLMYLVFVFVGIEGASVMGSRAKKKSDATFATVMSLVALILIYGFISLLPYGVMTRAQLAALPQPAMSGILAKTVGVWGEGLVDAGLIISCLGGLLSWTLLPVETTTLLTQDGLLPRIWGKSDRHGAALFSLIVTSLLETLFLFSFLITSNAYNFASTISSTTALVCYAFVSIYEVIYSAKNKKPLGLAMGVISGLFEILGLAVSGWQEVLLLSICYVPGFALFIYRRRGGLKKGQIAAIVCITALAVLAVVLVCLGLVSA
ncbi:MAG: amino acid permease [Aeriscardovia sp.]|nr:amino acid permease [Aeriscardovia sp.]